MPPAEVEIEEASAADAEAISTLALKTYVDTFGAEFEPAELAWHLDRTISPQRWADYLRQDRVLWAKMGSLPVGYVHFGPAEQPHVATVHRLYVDRGLQGRAIGSRLLERALKELELAGVETITIDVWQDNPGARRLYERFGFQHEGERVPFISSTGVVEGYDLVLVLRPKQK